MKISLGEIEARIKVKRVKVDGIQTYDMDNAYPQRIERHAEGSPRAIQCVGALAKFTRGKGLKDEIFYKSIINPSGLTVDKLNRKISQDLSLNNGFAVHVTYNGLGKKIAATICEFKEFRLPIPNEDGSITEIWHHPDWGKEMSGNFRKEKITKYKLFNDNPDVVIKQMIEAGGAAKYTGQVFWYSAYGLRYPLSSIDSVLEDVISDNEAKQFRLANIMTSFMDHTAVVTDEMASEDDRREFRKNISDFQGARAGRKVLHIEKSSTEQTFEIKHFDHPTGADKEFEYTENSVNENIRKPFMTPPVLLGDLVAGKMGTATEIEDAYKAYNAITYDYRLIVEEALKAIFSNWITPINPSGDYSILPLTFETEDQPLINKLPSGTSQEIRATISDTTITPEQKVQMLMIVYGVSEENARKLTGSNGSN